MAGQPLRVALGLMRADAPGAPPAFPLLRIMTRDAAGCRARVSGYRIKTGHLTCLI